MQIKAAAWAEKARHLVQNGVKFFRSQPLNIKNGIKKAPETIRSGAQQLSHDTVTFFKALPYTLSNFGHRTRDFSRSFNSLFILVFKRLKHNLGLSISGVVGIMAVLAMVVCVPVFSHAVSGQVLRSQLEEKAAETNRGLFSLHMYVVDQASASPLSVKIVNTVTQTIQQTSSNIIGTQVDRIIVEMQTTAVNWRPVKTQYDLNPDEPWFSMGFVALDGLPEHAQIIEGAWPEQSVEPNSRIQVAVLGETADTIFVNVGDVYRFRDLEVEIIGIWEPNDVNDPFWFQNPSNGYDDMMWVPTNTYTKRMGSYFNRPIFYASWYVVMDENDLRYAHAPQYARGLVRMDFTLKGMVPSLKTDYTPIDALNEYQQRAESMTTFFYAVGAPMVVLALLFISLTANIAVQQYEQETATMRGRGTSWQQISLLNLIESLVLLIVALIPSLLIGWFSAFMMGKTLSFLKFTNREGIPFSLEGLNLGWLLIAVVLIILSRFVPMLGVSKTTIVRMKQTRDSGKPIWQRFYLDFILLLPGVYSYLTMSGLAKNNKILARLQETTSTGQYRDMLLYVAPSLFAMALCMILLRILPLILRLLSKLVEKLPQVWLYLSIQQIARRPQDHSSAILLIMISLSLAIYSSSTAKTLDQWLHDSIYYRSGADLAVHEYMVSGGQSSGAPGSEATPTTVTDMDLSVDSYLLMEEHRNLPSVEGVTRVGKYTGTFSFGVGELRCDVMGIDRLDFPKTGFFRDDFSDESFGALMNALGSDLNAVLVPREIAEERGLRIGDQLDTTIIISDLTIDRSLIITGFYDYFATVFPGEKTTLIVNLDSIFDNPEAVFGYDIWLDLRDNANVEVVLYQLQQLAGGDKAVVNVTGDAFREMQKMLDEPERMGLFGVLNVGFLMTGLMPGIGFVLYSYASLRRRFIQLGILQAIGLSVKNLIGYLASEQFILMGMAILGGAAVGLTASYLFVPFLQVGETAGAPVPPFEVLIGWVESLVISFIFFLILVSTMIGTISYLIRMKVFQAVKMGETL